MLTGGVVGDSILLPYGDEEDAVSVVDADEEGVDQQRPHADAPRPARIHFCVHENRIHAVIVSCAAKVGLVFSFFIFIGTSILHTMRSKLIIPSYVI